MGPDDGYPIGRTVDGVDTEAVADHLGFNNQFGGARRCHREYVNSKTGRRSEAPEYSDGTDSYKPEGGY